MKAKTPQPSGMSNRSRKSGGRAGRPGHVGGRDRQGEVVRQQGDHRRLNGEDQADDYVPGAQAPQAPVVGERILHANPPFLS